MKKENGFRPYKFYTYIIPVLVVGIIIVFFALFSTWTSNNVSDIVFLSFLMIVSIFAIYYCYKLVKITIVFEEQVIRIIENKKCKEYYALYSDVPYGYYCRSYRKHLFLVLSAVSIPDEKVKKMINRNIFFEGVNKNNVIVIFINNASKSEKAGIEKIVSEKILHVKKI